MDTPVNIDAIVAENRRRMRDAVPPPYDPVTGVGCCGERTPVRVADGVLHLPKLMLADSRFSAGMARHELDKLRFEFDFEFWAATTIMIKDKSGWQLIPFTLNTAQRHILEVLERMRTKQQPIRIIVLKARQMGCSTLIQIYMAWIQIVHREYCNSLICSQSKDTSSIIKEIYSTALECYPEEYLDGKPMKLKGVSGASNISTIEARKCKICITSSSSSQNIRGADLALAHLSEAAYWHDSAKRSAESVIQSVCASILMQPMTMVAVESTANGVGNYFHNEWVKARAGKSDKVPVFVPWYETDIYRLPPPDERAFVAGMDDYEQMLWKKGLTLDRIYWYHQKRREYPSHKCMMAEYPTDDVEAFTSTSNAVFNESALEAMRASCHPAPNVGFLDGAAQTGSESLSDIRFTADSRGDLQVWEKPDTASDMRKRYVAGVDIGGRSETSDYSVIVVMDRIDPAHPRVVAQWRGHCDHDLLAWHAARIAKWYCDAVLIVESNTVETDRTEGDHGEYILHELDRHYRNLYRRDDGKPGFHTNRATKTRIINDMIGIVRNRGYTERDDYSINEALVYERKRNGGFGAMSGHHDDCVMARAMVLSYAKDLYLRDKRSAEAMAGWNP